MKQGVFNVYEKGKCIYTVPVEYSTLEDVLQSWRNYIIVWGDEYDGYVLEIDTDIFQAVYDSSEVHNVDNA